jgi:hypothetical protein
VLCRLAALKEAQHQKLVKQKAVQQQHCRKQFRENAKQAQNCLQLQQKNADSEQECHNLQHEIAVSKQTCKQLRQRTARLASRNAILGGQSRFQQAQAAQAQRRANEAKLAGIAAEIRWGAA